MALSTSARMHGLPYAARPIITPRRLGGAPRRMSCTSSRLLTPPLSVKFSSGNSSQRRKTRSYMSGGILRFCSGVSPFRMHLRAWMMKCLTPASATTRTKLDVNSGVSSSSTPKRHFTVTGSSTRAVMARMQSRTTSGFRMSAAPNSPLPLTRSEGHPQLRLISSYPHDWTISEAWARDCGTLPPSWQTIGCSFSPKSRNPSTRVAWQRVLSTHISVQSCAWRVRMRMNCRKSL
mmetsp:Transcript_65796/g.175931  ORF Transcript_65796/g.175931 Transcript_65796/m.175931 type:complete len:234 (-) Transcript_65796:66-767(-)